MATLTPQEADQRIQRLPKALRHVLFAGATADAVFDIGTKYKLLIDKMGELASEIGDFMIGATKPNEFVGNLERRLQIDKSVAKQIADDVNKQIFAPVRKELRELHGVEESDKDTKTEEVPQNIAETTEQSTASSLFDDKLNFVEEEGKSLSFVKNSSIETLKRELDEAVEEPPHLKESHSYSRNDPYRESITNDASPPPKPFPKSIKPPEEKAPPPPEEKITPASPMFSRLPETTLQPKKNIPPAAPVPYTNEKPFSSSPFRKIPSPGPKAVIDIDTIANEKVSFTPIEKKNDPPPPLTSSSQEKEPVKEITPVSPPEIVSLEEKSPETIPKGGAIPTFRGFSAQKKQVEGVPRVPDYLRPAASPPPPKPPTPPKPNPVKQNLSPSKQDESDPYREPIS
ncbi:MAG: hypothetical protein COU90_03830 [Candidatus Ryanbacteria bacterium CG10_big_fil_rev_8_21_14_0_10_43_42]|uniref:Uncharacterized protein n=1 Tax=Candidatus Ryanbacteria bacterium CG10_big_fil_rev_8_21_14_0_10_43_42 TaxID=1974864 RepID=A0A2M8KWC3_9BACT|nr:MAG: hypothetical protein COU90_03830 [Candidatus Ryanbacteria bacterium CG10_big_fil_rev_8_21_14_0_10_43_42]